MCGLARYAKIEVYSARTQAATRSRRLCSARIHAAIGSNLSRGADHLGAAGPLAKLGPTSDCVRHSEPLPCRRSDLAFAEYRCPSPDGDEDLGAAVFAMHRVPLGLKACRSDVSQPGHGRRGFRHCPWLFAPGEERPRRFERQTDRNKRRRPIVRRSGKALDYQ